MIRLRILKVAIKAEIQEAAEDVAEAMIRLRILKVCRLLDPLWCQGVAEAMIRLRILKVSVRRPAKVGGWRRRGNDPFEDTESFRDVGGREAPTMSQRQ